MLRITRTLAYENAHQERKIISQNEITSIIEPVVILGDPGLGKSVLTQMLGEQPGMKYYRAGTFVRTAKPEFLMAPGDRIIIDGLDEVASTAVGGGVEAVLKQLSAIGNPPFILSCREADWRGASDRIKIEDDYVAAPTLLHLQPFDRDDAQTFLSHEFPAVDATLVLDHLASRGLEDIYKNPLTLRLLGEVAQEDGVLPNSRAELLNRACRVMLKELNPRHLGSVHVRRSTEELMLAAGAMCTTLLLCDRTGVFTGAYAQTPEGFVNVADIVKLRFCEAANETLRTRLFQAEGEERFMYAHRVIAEYLGAKWLAHCFEAGISERRIFGLFRQGDGIPTSLRGLHAWAGHFSAVLAIRCISADPYAVLRYGDADTLDLDQARLLLTALAKLSDEDPYFRSEDWGHHTALGLMRVELKNEILTIISTPHKHTQLTTLLIDAMVGTKLSLELAPELEAMMFDLDRFYGERSAATHAMNEGHIVIDWEPVIHRLLTMGDADSARLAFEILVDIGPHTVAIQTAVETILANLGLTVCRVPRSKARGSVLVHLRNNLFDDFDTNQVAVCLDMITDYAQPLMRGAKHSSKAHISDLVRRLVVKVLESEPTTAVERVWAWISWLRGEGFDDKVKKQLAELLHKEYALRARLIEYVLLTPCDTNAWMAGFRLSETQLNLYPTSKDLVGVLEALCDRACDGAIPTEMWCDVLRLGRSREGIPDILRDKAIETANGNPILLAALAEMSKVVVPSWEIKQAKEIARTEAKRQSAYRSHRDIHTKRAIEVATGNYNVLSAAADAYLGHCNDFDITTAPEARLGQFLGDELAEKSLAGFIAVLGRDDLPSASDVARIHGEGKCWVAEKPMICGVAEMVRRGQSLDTVNLATLSAVYMAWQRTHESSSNPQFDIGPALEAVLFKSEAEIEQHFRLSIESQLASGMTHVVELYRLTHDTRWSSVAGRLSIEWLQTYSTMPKYVLSELMDCAIENASPDKLRAMVVECRKNIHPDYETRLMWLSCGFMVDFENSRTMIEAAAAGDRDFFWFVRNRVGYEGGDFSSDLSVSQLSFIVETFGSLWVKAERPGGITSGRSNPWDASEFIEHAIYAIAKNPTPEATETLRSLLRGPASTYMDTAQHALMLQRKARRDNEYIAPTVAQLEAVMAESLPETVDDMRAYFADRIETVQRRMKSSNTDMWEAYWEGNQPKNENFCRNRLVEHISGQLPDSIRFEPEMHMPEQKRADIAVIRNLIGLPVEIKGQWHSEVWTAPVNQLDAKYTHDWHAEGRGVYIVMWFGNLSGKQLPPHPEGLDRPKTPQALQQMLINTIPEARRSQIDVFVIDVTKPTKSN